MTALTPSERAAKRREKWQAEHPEDVFGTPAYQSVPREVEPKSEPAPETTDETEPESEPAPETTNKTKPKTTNKTKNNNFEEPLHD